jgi:cytidine deaminase
MDDINEDLIEAAREVQAEAHVPYSEYPVGAALEAADGSVYVGCNIENANYSNSLHAEEVAIAEAVKEGHREFSALAVSSARRDGVTPCGMCRQTLSEFCDDDMPVYCDEGDEEEASDEEGTSDGSSSCDGRYAVAEYALGELLPNTITEEMLE